MKLTYPGEGALEAAGSEAATHHALLHAVGSGQRRAAHVRRTVHAGPLIGFVSQLLLLGALASTVGLQHTAWLVGVTCAVILNLTLWYGLSHYRSEGLRVADWVTLGRATLAVGVAALIAQSFEQPAARATLVSLTALALTLDAVDGWIARRTRTTRAFGAQFDGEVDAFLILVLSVYVARFYGAWVLVIGAARYAFLAAQWPLTWMRAPLPARYWRKFVAATQGVVLAIAAAEVLPPAVSQTLLVAAVGLLAESFGRDVWWLWASRSAPNTAMSVTADLGAGREPAVATGKIRGRARRSLAAALTILAVVIVWAALVAPDRPSDLTGAGFVRVPLEALAIVLLGAILPVTGRRIVAGVIGPALAVLVILKALDIAFFTSFARPFDLIGDAGNAGIGIETLRAALGSTQADLLIVGGLVLAVSLIVVITLAMLRLMRLAAGNRRGSLGAAAALGFVWLLCSVSGAQLLSHTPIASTSTAGFLVHEVASVEADIHDEAVFANQIRHDPFRNTPGSELLTRLRGKDVLLVFLESYGRVSVQGSSFAPAIDRLLGTGTKQLQAAGFAARTAFLDAPGFGGLSWLAHSTLQAGLWANSQRRYNQLMGAKRLSLSDAFRRAGWRTINFAPADDRAWPEGSSFYHYDKIYDRRDMGYHGPTYNYAPMPDQYMFEALQRLELAKSDRHPLFAEVDTVSSHMPWDRIPETVPWNAVGNGSIFNHTPTFTQPDSFWWHPRKVKAAYARSLKYSLNTLISFVQRFGKKNLVLVVVGDEQPLPIVSGQGASHDVPISLIAHDRSVLRAVSGWGWESGLRPSPNAPVWRMSAFRDRFFTAFGSRPTVR